MQIYCYHFSLTRPIRPIKIYQKLVFSKFEFIQNFFKKRNAQALSNTCSLNFERYWLRTPTLIAWKYLTANNLSKIENLFYTGINHFRFHLQWKLKKWSNRKTQNLVRLQCHACRLNLENTTWSTINQNFRIFNKFFSFLYMCYIANFYSVIFNSVSESFSQVSPIFIGSEQ